MDHLIKVRSAYVNLDNVLIALTSEDSVTLVGVGQAENTASWQFFGEDARLIREHLEGIALDLEHPRREE